MDYQTGGGDQLHWSDILIIIFYFGFVLCVGLWSSYKSRGKGVQGYFLASRGMNWFLVGASLFGSNIGSEHFIGLAGTGAAIGIAVAGFELNAMFYLVLLGWLFLPVYIGSGVYTMPEYLMKRFGGSRIRIYYTCVSLLMSVLVKVSADLFAGSVFIKQALGWNLYAAIGLQLAISGIITVIGGLRAVMWVDTTQVILMVSGSIILVFISFWEVGGLRELERKFYLAIPSRNFTISENPNCWGIPPKDAMSLFREPTSSELPWSGMVFGLGVMSIWYWCTDQVIVQKALSSRNYSHAKLGCCLTGVFKALPFWLMVFPGMIARVLYPDEIGCTKPEVCEQICYSRNGCTNIAYPMLVTRLLPRGIRGIMIAVMMSTIMSSLSSIFNSSSTIFTMDIWRTVRKTPSELEVLIVGRLFVLFMVVVAVLWIPIIAAFPSSHLFNYVQSVGSYLAPPIAATFLLGILVPKVNEKGAFCGLIIGLVLGMIRFIMEIFYGDRGCDEIDTRPAILTKVHYLHFGAILFVICCVIILLVSFTTEPNIKHEMNGFTFWTRYYQQTTKISSDAKKNLVNRSKTETNGSPTREGNFDKFFRAMYCLCGLTNPSTIDSDGSEDKAHEYVASIVEDPTWRRISSMAAILLITVALFTYVYWG